MRAYAQKSQLHTCILYPSLQFDVPDFPRIIECACRSNSLWGERRRVQRANEIYLYRCIVSVDIMNMAAVSGPPKLSPHTSPDNVPRTMVPVEGVGEGSAVSLPSSRHWIMAFRRWATQPVGPAQTLSGWYPDIVRAVKRSTCGQLCVPRALE